MTWWIGLPSDQPANCSGVPSPATARFGAESSRLKPSTPVTVCGVLMGMLSSMTPSPGGEVASVSSRLPREDVHVLLVDSPLLSVAVTVTS